MLARIHRLRSRKEFSDVFRTGRMFTQEILAIKIRPTRSNAIHVGFSVGIKVSKKAVERNRIRRILQSIVNELLPAVRPGNDMVFFFIKKPGEINRDKLKNIVHQLIQKGGLRLK